MTYRVSWDIDIDDAASPLDAARKAHEIVRRPGTSANVYNVEAPDGVVTVVDLETANGPRAPDHAPSLQEVLAATESFISGFEGDPLQEGVDQLLAHIRAALRGRTDRQIVDETNALAGYIMAELIVKSEARLTLNVFGPGGEAIAEVKTVSISLDGLADIVDHATQLLILENMERRTSGVLAELRDALEVYGLLPPAP